MLPKIQLKWDPPVQKLIHSHNKPITDSKLKTTSSDPEEDLRYYFQYY